MTQLIGTRSSVEFGPGLPLLLINDQLRVYDQSPAIFEALRCGDVAPLVHLAQAGAEKGCQAVDILVDHHQLNEADLLPKVFRAVDRALGCPISIDSRNAAAIERAVDGYPGKAMLNSVVYETELLEQLLPLVAKYNMAVVSMLVDDVYIPPTWQERLDVARKILQITDAAGIPRQDIVFDCVCLAAAAAPNSMQVTLDTLKAVHQELGMSTILGIGNAGFGMPDQTKLDMMYLSIAASWGLDAALVDFHTEHLQIFSRAVDFLTARDLYGVNYIALYRKPGERAGRRTNRKRKRTR
jgi:5-methyltetrahydrofolate--homocysteine methyltransferase